MSRAALRLKEPSPQADESTLAEAIFQRLITRIHQGVLPAGARVNEALLAEEFHVSRGPVREAIRRLQGCQLVTREPYQRARVVSLTPEFMRELFEVRMALEGMACALAAHRLPEAELDAIARALEDYRRGAGAPRGRRAAPAGAGADKTFDFHERIVMGCGNQRIVQTLCGDLYHLLRIYRRQSGAQPERRDHAYQEHWQILRALRARDGLLAESLMRTHIERASVQWFSIAPAARLQ